MRFVTTALFALAAGSVGAQTTEHVVAGAGVVSCGEYLEHSKLDERSSVFVSWAQGFLSGLNIADKNSGKTWIYLPDAESIIAYLDRHCSTNPLSSTGEGAAKMYYELGQRQVGTKSK